MCNYILHTKYFMITKLHLVQTNSGNFHSMKLGDCMTLQMLKGYHLNYFQTNLFYFSPLMTGAAILTQFLENANIRSLISYFVSKQKHAFPHLLKFT